MTLLETYRKNESSVSSHYRKYMHVCENKLDDGTDNDIIKNNDDLEIIRKYMCKINDSKHKIFKQIDQLFDKLNIMESSRSYYAIEYVCKQCGREVFETKNIFMDIDFNNMICEKCENKQAHKQVVDIIENMKNCKCEINSYGNIDEITFESNGKRFIIRSDESEIIVESDN